MTLTLTLKVASNVAMCLEPTFHFSAGYSEHDPNPNAKSYSECYVPRSNFPFGRVEWGYSEHDPNQNPKRYSKCHYMPRSNFSFFQQEAGVWGGGILTMTLTLTLKVVSNVATILDPIFHLARAGGYCEHDPNPNPSIYIQFYIGQL